MLVLMLLQLVSRLWLVLVVQVGFELWVAQDGVLEAADGAEAGQAVLVERGQVVNEATARAVRTHAVTGEVHALLSLRTQSHSSKRTTEHEHEHACA